MREELVSAIARFSQSILKTEIHYLFKWIQLIGLSKGMCNFAAYYDNN